MRLYFQNCNIFVNLAILWTDLSAVSVGKDSSIDRDSEGYFIFQIFRVFVLEQSTEFGALFQ